MNIAVILSWAVAVVLAVSILLRIVRWLRREPNKRDLALGDLLVLDQPLEMSMKQLTQNARREAVRYLVGSAGITIVLITATTLSIALQSTPGKVNLLLANALLWCGFGVAMSAVLITQLVVGFRKASHMLASQQSKE